MEAYLDDESESMVNLPPDMYMECYEYMACPTPREVSTNNSFGSSRNTTILSICPSGKLLTFIFHFVPKTVQEAPTESPIAGDGTTELDEQIRNR